MKVFLKILVTYALVATYMTSAADESKGNPLADLAWKEGPTTAKVGSVASQKVGKGYLFLESIDARKFLELTENPSSESNVGVIAKASEDSFWWASYEYEDIGYVSDEEKGSLDADAILESIRENTKLGNAERRRRGWPELTILGWAREPHYDEKTHNLEWAVRVSSSKEVSVNYNTRILGRRGVMSVTLVCEPEQLSTVLPEFKSALRDFGYNAGNRYSEYRSGDRTAEIGLTALIVGGATAAAVKTGASKWIWKGLVAIAVAVGGLFKKLFGKRKQDQ